MKELAVGDWVLPKSEFVLSNLIDCINNRKDQLPLTTRGRIVKFGPETDHQGIPVARVRWEGYGDMMVHPENLSPSNFTDIVPAWQSKRKLQL